MKPKNKIVFLILEERYQQNIKINEGWKDWLPSKETVDTIQDVGDWVSIGASFIPVVGQGIAAGIDATSAAIDTAQGDYGDAAFRGGMAALNAVPLAGGAGKLALKGARTAGKVVGTGIKLAKGAGEAVKIARGVGEAGKIAAGAAEAGKAISGVAKAGEAVSGAAKAAEAVSGAAKTGEAAAKTGVAAGEAAAKTGVAAGEAAAKTGVAAEEAAGKGVKTGIAGAEVAGKGVRALVAGEEAAAKTGVAAGVAAGEEAAAKTGVAAGEAAAKGVKTGVAAEEAVAKGVKQGLGSRVMQGLLNAGSAIANTPSAKKTTKIIPVGLQGSATQANIGLGAQNLGRFATLFQQ
jgi:hypothetical protein